MTLIGHSPFKMYLKPFNENLMTNEQSSRFHFGSPTLAKINILLQSILVKLNGG